MKATTRGAAPTGGETLLALQSAQARLAIVLELTESPGAEGAALRGPLHFGR